MRNKKLGAQLPGAGQVPRGQAAGVQSWGSFVLGGEAADLSRDAVREGSREAPADGGVPGADMVRGWWHKDVVRFGEEPHLLAQTKPNPHDLGCF